MKIHHATQKKADAKNITIDMDVDFARFNMTDDTTGFRQSFVNASFGLDVILLARMVAAEYPIMSLKMMKDGERVKAYYGDDDRAFAVGTWKEKAPTLNDLIEACARHKVSIEDTEDTEYFEEVGETEEVAGNVVPTKYRLLYAARGNPNNCGDWLAKFLERFSEGGAFSYNMFHAFLSMNGVDTTGKWAALLNSGTKGWQGRYRMCGRRKLEHRIAETGLLLWEGESIEIPEGVLKDMRSKFKTKEPS